eukprot:4212712-Pleurochrysis_carterae.AAC.1
MCTEFVPAHLSAVESAKGHTRVQHQRQSSPLPQEGRAWAASRPGRRPRLPARPRWAAYGDFNGRDEAQIW